MSAALSILGLISCIWLVSDSEPGSFWFIFGVVFGVLNAAVLLRGDA